MSEISIKAAQNKRFWIEFMNRKSDDRTDEQWEVAYNLSVQWDTCACGSINDGLERLADWNWEPIDSRLTDLGDHFMELIEAHDLDGARDCFNEIQMRAGVVLKKKFEEELFE